MTDAQKTAKELVAEFKMALTDFDASHENAKKCAIICVKHMIREVNRFENYPLHTRDLEDVIEEINKQ